MIICDPVLFIIANTNNNNLKVSRWYIDNLKNIKDTKSIEITFMSSAKILLK